MLRWLWRSSEDLGVIRPWHPVIAERHARATARMLLGACGRARVVGLKRHDAFWQQIEQQQRASEKVTTFRKR